MLYIRSCHLQTNTVLLSSSCLIWLLFYSCLHGLSRPSTTIKGTRVGTFILFLIFLKLESFLAVVCHLEPLLWLSYIPPTSSLLRVFIMKIYWIFWMLFSISMEMIIQYFFLILLTLRITFIDLCILTVLASQSYSPLNHDVWAFVYANDFWLIFSEYFCMCSLRILAYHFFLVASLPAFVIRIGWHHKVSLKVFPTLQFFQRIWEGLVLIIFIRLVEITSTVIQSWAFLLLRGFWLLLQFPCSLIFCSNSVLFIA